MKTFQKYMATIMLTVGLPSFAGEVIDESMKVDDATIVVVENLRGNVDILGMQSDSILITGELEDKAKGLTFERSGSRINIKVEIAHNSYNDHAEQGSQLTIKLPSNMRVNFNGVSSDVSIKDVNNGVDIQTVSGDIVAKNLSDKVELIAVSGNIDSDNLSGKIRLSSVSGDIEDKNSVGRAHFQTVSGHLMSQSSAKEIVAKSVSGDIELDLATVDELIVSTVSGEFEGKLALNDNGLIKMSSVSGDLLVNFQNDVQASFNLKTNAGGNIVNKLTTDKAKRAKYGPSAKLSFETGNGASSVRASTVSGSIEVK